MTLYSKITRTLIILISIIVAGTVLFMTAQWVSTLRSQMAREAKDIAVSISLSSEVADNIVLENGRIAIQNYIERLRLKTRIQYIYVVDSRRLFYAHNDYRYLGKPCTLDRIEPVLMDGEPYIHYSDIPEPFVEAGYPVYSEGLLSGAVIVGMLNGRIYQEISWNLIMMLVFIFVVMLAGVAVAYRLTGSIKRSIRGLEPEEISLLLGQKEIVLQNIRDGLVVVDNSGRLVMFNSSAERLLGLGPAASGRSYRDMFFAGGIDEAFRTGETVTREVRRGPAQVLLGSYYPVFDGESRSSVGIMAAFEDLTVARQRAEELTGMRELTQALRAQNHEFMNKLHTISGMIQLGAADEAISYITGIASARQEIVGILSSRIRVPAVAGLLLAKYNRAAELKIELEVDPLSSVTRLPENLSPESLSSVIGNLVENSMEVLSGSADGRINVRILEDESCLEVLISDNGPGIPAEDLKQIYNEGFSTKGSGRGYGLFLVGSIVREAGGTIEYTDVNTGGAEFAVCFLRGGGV